jgi:hypothetical protein
MELTISNTAAATLDRPADATLATAAADAAGSTSGVLPLLDIRQASRLLNCSTATTRSLVLAGRLASVRLVRNGKHWFTAAALAAFVVANQRRR